jgi:hypothetical protein
MSCGVLTGDDRSTTITVEEVHMRYRLPSLLLIRLMLTPAGFTQIPTLGLNAPQLYEKGMNSLMGMGVSRNDLNGVDYRRVMAAEGCRSGRSFWATIAGTDPAGKK